MKTIRCHEPGSFLIDRVHPAGNLVKILDGQMEVC